jgi:hypothetical protein
LVTDPLTLDAAVGSEGAGVDELSLHPDRATVNARSVNINFIIFSFCWFRWFHPDVDARLTFG